MGSASPSSSTTLTSSGCTGRKPRCPSPTRNLLTSRRWTRSPTPRCSAWSCRR
ncbi:hypothetical protein PR202_ga23983 [Eleusine coracana subsp. coracana]|uniref:Uncharacterized protein n=1 Tax=Eleusine coracana subsp. coracana TaxID=191504 RepID=A0AAV5D6M6_ELECO|nr:hypothetical protein PR202_ga23983 [Eleusine coracana subsp. coracana]